MESTTCMSIGVLMPEDLVYLDTLSRDAPLQLYESPFVFLSSPTETHTSSSPITEMPGRDGLTDLAALVDSGSLGTLPFRFRSARAVYNINANRTEFAVVSYAADSAGAVRTMLPYFVWALDPWRSRHSKSWLTSIQGTLRNDNRTLRVIPLSVPVDSAYARTFNSAVYEAALGAS